jgi:O-antigen/teichoic acid export membrane protein
MSTAPRPVRTGAVLMGVAQIVTAAGGFLTTVAIARLLGADGVAAYTVAISIVQIGSILGSLGLENGIAWAVAGGRWAPRAALRQTQALAALLGLVTIALALGFRVVFPDAFGGLSVALVAVAALGLPCWISWQYARWLAVALDRYESFVVPPALSTLLALATCGVGAAVDGIDGMVIGLSAAYAVTAVVALVDAVRSMRRPGVDEPVTHGLGRLREATGFGLRANATNALQTLNLRIDLFVLSAVTSAAALGHYSVAVSVTSVLFLAPQTLAQVVFPRVAALSAAEGDAEATRANVEAKSLRHVSLLTLITVPIVAVAAAVLVPLLYGSDFDAAVVLTLILLPGCALFGIASVLSATINGRGRPGLSLWAAAWSTPVALALYATLIPAFDAVGAACASTGAYTANFLLTTIAYKRATGDRVAPLLVPTRDELADLRALARRG